MKTFSNMSTPDLIRTNEAYDCYKQECFTRLTDLDKNGGREADLQDLSDRIKRINELMTAIESEMYNRSQDD